MRKLVYVVFLFLGVMHLYLMRMIIMILLFIGHQEKKKCLEKLLK